MAYHMIRVYEDVKGIGEFFVGHVERNQDAQGRIELGKTKVPVMEDREGNMSVFVATGIVDRAKDLTPVDMMSDEMRLASRLAGKANLSLNKVRDTRLGDGIILEAEEGNYDGEDRWWAYKSYEDAETAAEEYVEEQLRERPESFNDRFLNSHTTFRENRVDEIVREQARHFVNDIDEDRLKEEAEHYNVKNTESLSVRELRDEVRQEQIEALKHNMESQGKAEWFMMNYAWSREDLRQKGILRIDIESAAEDAVRTDGEGHFLDIYDGSGIELEWSRGNYGVAYGR